MRVIFIMKSRDRDEDRGTLGGGIPHANLPSSLTLLFSHHSTPLIYSEAKAPAGILTPRGTFGLSSPLPVWELSSAMAGLFASQWSCVPTQPEVLFPQD